MGRREKGGEGREKGREKIYFRCLGNRESIVAKSGQRNDGTCSVFFFFFSPPLPSPHVLFEKRPILITGFAFSFVLMTRFFQYVRDECPFSNGTSEMDRDARSNIARIRKRR